MLKSSYNKKFSALFKELEGKAILRGDAMLVEILDEPEFTIGSSKLIHAASLDQARTGVTEHQATVGLVLAVGNGYYDNDLKVDVPIDIPVGSVVMLPRYSMMELSTFPGLASLTGQKLGLISEREVNFYYKDLECYEKAREVLNNDN